MGCLNSNRSFKHVFGNIHLSGPCNRSCYFCIGQHMMDLDPLNNLDMWPLAGLEQFSEACRNRGVTDIFVTGTNTDPLLYRHTGELVSALYHFVPNVRVGIRTNAVALKDYRQLQPYDMGSVTVCSFDPDIYRAMMGQGEPPNIGRIVRFARAAGWDEPPKVNVVLGPENRKDVLNTIRICQNAGIKRINLREPYGQPTIGDVLAGSVLPRINRTIHGMPLYRYRDTTIAYWDVHYCEVESVNLYASGRVSEDYPITRGHSDNGTVKDQSNFEYGRHNEQWVSLRRKSG